MKIVCDVQAIVDHLITKYALVFSLEFSYTLMKINFAIDMENVQKLYLACNHYVSILLSTEKVQDESLAQALRDLGAYAWEAYKSFENLENWGNYAIDTIIQAQNIAHSQLQTVHDDYQIATNPSRDELDCLEEAWTSMESSMNELENLLGHVRFRAVKHGLNVVYQIQQSVHCTDRAHVARLHENISKFQNMYKTQWPHDDSISKNDQMNQSRQAHFAEKFKRLLSQSEEHFCEDSKEVQKVLHRFTTTLRRDGSFRYEDTINQLMEIRHSFGPQFSSILAKLNASIRDASGRHQSVWRFVQNWCINIIGVLNDTLDQTDAVMKDKIKQMRKAFDEGQQRLLSAENVLCECNEDLHTSAKFCTSLLTLARNSREARGFSLSSFDIGQLHRMQDVLTLIQEIHIARTFLGKANNVVQPEMDCVCRMIKKIKLVKINVKTRQRAKELRDEAEKFVALLNES